MKHTTELTREGKKHTFTTSKGKTLNFFQEREIITADTYTRVWCWRNQNEYKKILSVIS